VIKGCLAAALTPLRDGSAAFDEDAVPGYVDFLAAGGVDGILALGTTGEGVLFSVEERKRIARVFAAAAGDRLDVAVHCGAQTTADTVALAADAASLGVAAVAVISPPYFPLDEESQLAHLAAAAAACAPTPFYVYEFEARSGYAVAPSVVERLREIAPNLAGMKVSDSPLDRVTPYLFDGLDIFVGAEPLIFDAVALGAVGSVSGLSSAFPDVVSAIVHEPTAEGAAVLDRLRQAVSAFPFQPALKVAAAARGAAIREDVRAPLRTLTADEKARLAAAVAEFQPAAA
jgi:dihydrodipicolinate synthase/N-acetylneuraminate lyase